MKMRMLPDGSFTLQEGPCDLINGTLARGFLTGCISPRNGKPGLNWSGGGECASIWMPMMLVGCCKKVCMYVAHQSHINTYLEAPTRLPVSKHFTLHVGSLKVIEDGFFFLFF